MKESGEDMIKSTYEAGLMRVEYIGGYRGPSVIDFRKINGEIINPNIEINGRTFDYSEKGDEKFGSEIKEALGDLENILKQIAKNSKEDGNFKITFMKFVPCE